jgi:hypothetical protein
VTVAVMDPPDEVTDDEPNAEHDVLEVLKQTV